MNEKKNKLSINDWWIYENHVCEMRNEKWIWKLSSQKWTLLTVQCFTNRANYPEGWLIFHCCLSSVHYRKDFFHIHFLICGSHVWFSFAKQKVSPILLHLHLLLENPHSVFRPQLFPLQYWHIELQLKSVPLHWPLLQLSFRVQRSPSLHATPSLSDQVLTFLLMSHLCKQNIKSKSLIEHSRQNKWSLHYLLRLIHIKIEIQIGKY